MVLPRATNRRGPNGVNPLALPRRPLKDLNKAYGARLKHVHYQWSVEVRHLQIPLNCLLQLSLNNDCPVANDSDNVRLSKAATGPIEEFDPRTKPKLRVRWSCLSKPTSQPPLIGFPLRRQTPQTSSWPRALGKARPTKAVDRSGRLRPAPPH